MTRQKFQNQASLRGAERFLGKYTTEMLGGGTNLASVWAAMLASSLTQQKSQTLNSESKSFTLLHKTKIFHLHAAWSSTKASTQVLESLSIIISRQQSTFATWIAHKIAAASTNSSNHLYVYWIFHPTTRGAAFCVQIIRALTCSIYHVNDLMPCDSMFKWVRGCEHTSKLH